MQNCLRLILIYNFESIVYILYIFPILIRILGMKSIEDLDLEN